MTSSGRGRGKPTNIPPLAVKPTAAAAGPTPAELPPPTPKSIRIDGGWYVPKGESDGRA